MGPTCHANNSFFPFFVLLRLVLPAHTACAAPLRAPVPAAALREPALLFACASSRSRSSRGPDLAHGSTGPRLHPRQLGSGRAGSVSRSAGSGPPTAPPAAGRTGSARPSSVSGSAGSACPWLHQLPARPSHACMREGDDAHTKCVRHLEGIFAS
jgi:hypothetical protein